MKITIESVDNGFIVKELADTYLGAEDDQLITMVFSKPEGTSNGCSVDYIISMLYSILEILGTCSDKGSEHNVTIGCVEGKWVDEAPMCPNREDYFDRRYPEDKEEE